MPLPPLALLGPVDSTTDAFTLVSMWPAGVVFKTKLVSVDFPNLTGNFKLPKLDLIN
jgi:hypothetical protein